MEYSSGYQPPPPQVQPSYPVQPQLKTNGMAIAAMVLGITWLGWIGSILALVFGYIARSQIEQSGGREQGQGMAMAGIVLGWVGIGFLLLFLLAMLAGVLTTTIFFGSL